ncbi:alcohol dehydrogenase catalytic domain-containing protein [Saccharopolyspora shandongensis]|uniref:alcohol dehydrogenase catalytic domain-containing protein n=1 Tax=Saccharopolyspora shandongensis TaxID=418495 RepID=UPI003408506A
MIEDTAAVLHGPRDVRIGAVARDAVRPGQVRVEIRGVGLCGSDLHYFADGRNGSNVVSQPTVLGHEGFGVITETGPGVPADRIGERVAIEPAAPCLRCPTCLAGRYNVCPHGTCLGSPPTHGLLRASAVLPAQFAHPLPDSVPDAVASLVEPLAVACWAVDRVSPLAGRRVLVTGAGPIGLATLQAALAEGAAEVVVSDVVESRLRAASDLGATVVVVAGEGDVEPVDVALECSGSAAALKTAANSLRPGGVLGLVGVHSGAEAVFPVQLLQRWELDVRGCFRYGPGAFRTAISWLARARVDLAPLVTARFPLAESARALELALADRSQLKVVIDGSKGNS